jgi:hypothetical protein
MQEPQIPMSARTQSPITTCRGRDSCFTCTVSQRSYPGIRNPVNRTDSRGVAPIAGTATVTNLPVVPVLQISRRRELQGLLSVWFLFVDDVSVARLRSGDAASVTVGTGRHTFMVGLKSRRTRSNAVEMEVSSPEPIHLDCRMNPAFRKLVFLGRTGTEFANSPIQLMLEESSSQ